MKKRHTRIIGIVLAVSLLAPSSVYFGALAARQPDGAENPGSAIASASSDQEILADISNMTGVPTQEITKLRAEGLNWNQVLVRLQADPYASMEEDRTSRIEALMGEKDGEAVINELIQAGFSREQILQAKLLAERVQVQLASIADSQTSWSPAPPAAVMNSGGAGELLEDKEETEAYSKLAEAFQTSGAIAFMIRLQDEFGGLEQALNEYLLALQLGLNPEDRAAEPGAYEEAKKKRLSENPLFRAITIQSLEEKALEQLQESNRQERENNVSTGQAGGTAGSVLSPAAQEDGPLPAAPASMAPDVRDVKPVNPAEQIMKEIENLNPNKQK
ncbi:hypothetical protein [Paenibacillus sp. YN15]|uniref:hypothetical protein n=1 Tax=Paenibacillus sp. YN15 TaxID=1742774 RepID=UPI000DCBBF00|nr:hypothetical protein [Paenibacillus sp. YN15]RAV02635.1 hypothetical protein DQG13_08970 [Paenibacillus sp. YN15]